MINFYENNSQSKKEQAYDHPVPDENDYNGVREYIADNGFGEYYKPSAALFDAVAAKRVLILSPWDYDPDKKHVSRADCVAMNQMAEEIAGM